MNYCDDIVNSLNANPKDWEVKGLGFIYNKTTGVEVFKLGNGEYTGWVRYCISILGVKIKEVQVDVLRRDRKKIEIAYVKWLRSIDLESVVK